MSPSTSKGVKRPTSANSERVIKKRRGTISDHPNEKPEDAETENQNWLNRWEDRKGTLLVAGQGEVGQLGLGEDVIERKKFVPIMGLGSKVVSINAGGMHSAALDEDGVVWTWGCNDEGALGRPTTDGSEESVPGRVQLPGRCTALSAGDSHTTALLQDGRLMAWGSFRGSMGGMGFTIKDNEGSKCTEPMQLVLPNLVTNVVSGADHIVALTSRGQVFTLGCAEQGQLGRISPRSTSQDARNRLASFLTPSQMELRKGLKRSASRASTPAAQAADTSGLLSGDGSGVSAIWAGSHSTFLCGPGGNIYACGLNNYSQLGIKTGEDKNIVHWPELSDGFNKPPLELVTENGELTTRPFSARVQWKQIACGIHHTLALDSEGRVFALGRPEYGRLGLGNFARDSAQPVQLPALKDVRCVGVSAGIATSLAVSDQGAVYAWGAGSDLALGTGEEDNCLEPVRVASRALSATSLALQVSAGDQHSMVLLKGPVMINGLH